MSIPYAYVKTQRLLLRRPVLDDSHAVFRIHADPRTNQHNPAGPLKDLSEVHALINQWITDWSTYRVGYWCVALQDDSEIIGVSGVRVIEWSGRQVLNLYYRFVPSAWGKGYAVEVGQEAMRVAETYFSHMPIVVRTRLTNKSAMRVAEKLSLTRFTNLDTPEHVVYASWW